MIKISDKKKLFPEYLDSGAKNPAAVALLQIILKVSGHNAHAIKVDGDYGKETTLGVEYLQDEYGIEADGNFGPETRQWLFRDTGLDVNELLAETFAAVAENVMLEAKSDVPEEATPRVEAPAENSLEAADEYADEEVCGGF